MGGGSAHAHDGGGGNGGHDVSAKQRTDFLGSFPRHYVLSVVERMTGDSTL